MLFNSAIFLFLFLPICYAGFWTLRTAQQRYVWLTITGYVFYGYWDWRFCFLMAFSTLVSFTAGLGMLRWDQNPKRRKLCLVTPVVVDLALLGFFKYANFAAGSLQGIASWFGVNAAVPHLDIILPIGISFYTFHTISYIVDSYRRVIRPTRNLFEFSAYVSLFSQLVAGPIVRFRQIEQDLEHLGDRRRTRWLHRGLSFFTVGLVEKVIIADSLAGMVDPALAAHQMLSTGGAWLAMIGYSLQLYFDFSGYSTMAVGLGYLFGIRIPQNFNSPYKSRDPSEFWRRWHISLSTCLRDYVYIPLGGSRVSELGTYRNLMLTMLIGGLWHGAAWTFIVWGAYHGALLALHRRFAHFWDPLPPAIRQSSMLVLVIIGWVFFRSTSFTMAASLLRTMFSSTAGVLVPQPALSVLAISVAGALAVVGPNAFDLRHEPSWRARFAVTIGFAASLAIVIGTRSTPFLYFQF